MRRAFLIAILLSLCASINIRAQGYQHPGLLYSIDRLMSSGRISSSGNRASNVKRPQSLPYQGVELRFGSSYISEDYAFVQHLVDNKLYTDLSTLFSLPLYHSSDTLFYLGANAHYQSRRLYDAIELYDSVPSSSVFYSPSLFYSTALKAWTGQYDAASKRLRSYNGEYKDVQMLQSVGIAALQRDFDSYDAMLSAPTFSSTSVSVTDAYNEIITSAESIRGFKPKSPMLSAAASALIPGLGKCYSGRIGEGVASFLTVGSFAAITAENWYKCGASDWKTILFGTITAFTYAANIYGSYISASLYNIETVNGYETNILVSLILPLHSVFRSY